MSCCKKAAHAAHMEDLKASALGFGLDMAWIGEIIEKYGDDVLGLIVEALRTGFSRELVTEIITKFGPLILEFLVNLTNKQKMKAISGDVIVGEEVGILDISIIEMLIQKYLPLIIEKYGDHIVQFILTWVVNNLLKK